MLGLEEGVAARSARRASPFLDDDRRRELDGRRRLAKADPVSRAPLPLLHRVHACRRGGSTSCARRRPTTARRASRARSGTTSAPSSIRPTLRAGRAGARSPRSSGRSRALRPSASGCARSRGSRTVTAPLRARSGARERLGAPVRSRAGRLQPADAPDRPERARDCCGRRATFGVTELETFAGCSSIWFVERVLDPKSMDAEIDARMRGSIAHQALFKFFSGLPKRLRLGARTGRPARRGARVPARVPQRGDRGRGGIAARADRPPAQRAAAGALARPGGARPRRGGVGAAARPAPLRGLVRLRALGAGAPARPRPGDLPPLREDRPDRPRSVRRARDRLGLQVGQDGALRGADRERAEAPDPAVHARAARPRRRRAARRPLPAARRRPQGARAPSLLREGGRRPRLLAQRLRGRGATSGRRSVAPRTPRARSSSASATATCTTTRATAHARRGASSLRCAG